MSTPTYWTLTILVILAWVIGTGYGVSRFTGGSPFWVLFVIGLALACTVAQMAIERRLK